MQKILPELAEPLLVSLEQLSHVEAVTVGCVPLLELLEVWVAAESHAERSDRVCACLPGSDTQPAPEHLTRTPRLRGGGARDVMTGSIQLM